ncbi:MULTISPECIES: FAD binding domain-containing protein [Streptomyces]|uniref:Xanthine dehydrogenase subunit XdhB n=1 Tax=Streptomyces chartreusis NRRL 3882 TaxID=1079985 RepID=A0A2N9BLS0_STRCX|nr:MULTISPECIES: FAD binding domain-containing protein [Streptomyces]MYS88689.1 FAD-binding molybdopterin dehydrogenase [Streptomyces sp. SID5464]SOR84313.1 xanthine dehydrogenase subunit XdhB [Streptomyces chartreusis NRRL 3882]
MDLTAVREVVDGRIPLPWRQGDAWLAGGTTLFAEPRPGLRRLRDLTTHGWPPLTVTEAGIEVAATCTITELLAFAETPGTRWPSGRALIAGCCRAFSSSFKVWNTATVGGNLCAALPAGPMISMAVALSGTCRVRGLDGAERVMPVQDFVTGPGSTGLAPGELLRSLTLPAGALAARSLMRRVNTHAWGRSVALVTGTRGREEGRLSVTVTAATTRPVTVVFECVPSPDELRGSLLSALPRRLLLDDVHGRPPWRRHLAVHLAEKVRSTLAEER